MRYSIEPKDRKYEYIILNLLDTTSDNLPRFNTKKWIETHDQSAES